MKTYECIHCKKVCKWGHSKVNKYCSTECQRAYEYETIHKPRVIAGEVKDGSPTLRKFLIESHGEICTECGIGLEYNGKPLTLTVDHIDGDSDNNFPSNLRLLCPNCHSQTDTFKGRNKKNSTRSRYQRKYRDRLAGLAQR
jgi:hypothetical protein